MSLKEEIRKRFFEKLEIGLSDASVEAIRAIQVNPKLTLVAIPRECIEFNKDGTVTIPEMLYQHMVRLITK